jgi:hypothetical protein
MTARQERPHPDRPNARTWWRCVEPLHAVTYFAPECRQALTAVGLRGFWMGYFAARAAPLGTVGPATVCATFFNFHQTLVGRAIPDAWTFADPSSILRARRTGAATALRRVDPSVEQRAEALLPWLDRVVDAADGSGRVLFSANRALGEVGEPGGPVEALWQACTSLREHRGDGHVAALTAGGLDGCEALVLFALSEGIPGALFRDSRGWSPDEWEAARGRLEGRGLVAGGQLSSAGAELRRSVEQLTDELAGPPYAALEDEEQLVVLEGLQQLVRSVMAAGVIPFPNPIGLPAPEVSPPQEWAADGRR